MKIHRKKCSSIKELNKIIRKYGKYFNNKYIYNTFWYTWVWVDILNPWDENLIRESNRLKEKGNKNLSHIIKIVQDNYNWEFLKNDTVYQLKGIEISNEDYYYIYVNKYGNKLYLSCVGHFYDIK